MNYYPEFF